MKLTWRDIVRAHRHVRKTTQLYKSEQEIFQQEANYINKLLARRTKKEESSK